MGLLHRQLTSHLPLLAGRGRLWLALSVALLLLGLFAAGCSYFRPAADPYAELRQSWRPGYEMTTAELEALPAYSMTRQDRSDLEGQGICRHVGSDVAHHRLGAAA